MIIYVSSYDTFDCIVIIFNYHLHFLTYHISETVYIAVFCALSPYELSNCANYCWVKTLKINENLIFVQLPQWALVF